MTYTDSVTQQLIKVIDYASGLPVHKLAGYASNLDFWVAEIRHCLDVIDGYERRYQRMRQGERKYYDEHKDEWQKRRRMGQSPQTQKRSIKAHELSEVRKAIVSASDVFFFRCWREGFIDAEGLRRIGSILGVDLRPIANDHTG